MITETMRNDESVLKLHGKKVIVTGANRSIGKTISLLFAKEEAHNFFLPHRNHPG